MPGWHAKTKQLVKDNKLIVLGIAPEQHGDRMALFLQWKGMEDMAVMLDSYNLLGLKAVPITLLIDESGIIRHRNPKQKQLEEFLAAPPSGVGSAPQAPRPGPLVPAQHTFSTTSSGLSNAVAAYNRLRDGTASFAADFHFQRGVALRKLYDREGLAADPDHFRQAVASWRRALQMDPSNYIWRRRLQQYGPRLDKPYPFYDWVTTAREELQARGVAPHPLLAEPRGAELAHPLRNGDAAANAEKFPHPDPNGDLPHDEFQYVACTALVVPHTKTPGQAVRVYVTLTPKLILHAKWNDEAGHSTIRIHPPEGWSASESTVVVPPTPENAGLEIDTAPRQVEFDLRRDAEAAGDETQEISFQLYYNICHGEDRVCQFLRRDLAIPLAIDAVK